jgi:hypothetical protein
VSRFEARGTHAPPASAPLPVGKVRAALLAGLFDTLVTLDEGVVLGPRVGEDEAVIDLGDRYLVARRSTAPTSAARCRARRA